jgi:hypothetical protein
VKRRGLLRAALFLVLAAAHPGHAQEWGCRSGDIPGATLLFPYFEVDLDGGRTTLIAISSIDQGEPTLARATLWTDWGVPTVAFDLLIQGSGAVTINLRDVLATGRAPETGPGGNQFGGCSNFVGGQQLWAPQLLQRAHTGRAADGDLCYSSARADTTIATGYVTVDHTVRCALAGTTPQTPGYFGGSHPVASDFTYLMGDYFQVDPVQNYAGGQAAVPIVATPNGPGPLLEPGDYSFYGSLVSFSGADNRLPLSNRWQTRFLQGGAFNGGTHLIVWRDIRDFGSPRECTSGNPRWFPLGERRIVAVSEDRLQSRTSDNSEIFDLATQRVPVSALGLTFPFGVLTLELDHRDGTTAQAWVGWDANAEGRFNVSLAGIPLRDPCTLSP